MVDLVSDSDEIAGYVGDAIAAFNEIMSGSRKNTFEDINRANKGEIFVLHFLSARDSQALPSELSTALHATTGRISALLGNLEKKGLIEREIDKSNRRNILVTITEAGRNYVETEMGKLLSGLTKVFTEMGETDTREFLRLTKRFFELMQEHMPNREDFG